MASSASSGVLTDSHLINAQHTASSDTRPPLTHKRSVKSISRKYEPDNTTPPVASPLLSPAAAATDTIGGRRSSLLLASGTYPSTLTSTPPRPRTLSSSSTTSSNGVTSSRSPSIRLASGSYPSTLQPPSRKTSTSSLQPLPSPPSLIIPMDDMKDTDTSDPGLLEAMDGVPDLSPKQSVPSPSAADLSQLTAAERREHSRRHSHIHARNLSVFFPQPGTEAEIEADQAKAGEVYKQTHNLEPTSQVHRRMGSGNRPQITVSTSSPGEVQEATFQDQQKAHSHGTELSPSPSKSRRGHHHRHSVAMFDTVHGESSPSPRSAPMVHSASSASHNSETFDTDHHTHHQHHHHHHYDTKRSLHTRTVSALGHIPQTSRPLMLFGISHFGLGAALWVAGQQADSLAATGLGYLVVFDAMGILGNAVADWASEWEQHASDLRRRNGKLEAVSLRRPYGTHRVATLLQFVQTIYLLFASVYVLKESIEHALLQGGDADIAESASGHEHSHAHAEQASGLLMPNTLLALSLAACLFSNLVMGNHARLVAACGISTAASAGAGSRGGGHGRSGSVLMRPSELASPVLALLANPFSLTVLFFSATLLFAGITMPPIQVAALDKVLAGLESVSMFYVAYPASVALGRVLLQTAPDITSPAKQQLTRALRTVEEHPLVSYVAPPSLWQLTPPTSSLTEPGVLTGAGSRTHTLGRGGIHYGSKTASTIASVSITLTAEATQQDCFDMTKWVWERLAPSIGAGRGLLAGEMLRGALRAGELTVSVKRESHLNDGQDVHFAHAHDHGHHDHGHYDHHGHHNHDQHDHHDHKHHDHTYHDHTHADHAASPCKHHH